MAAPQVIVIGGPATGKTTLSNKILELNPKAKRFYVSDYAVRIQATLLKKGFPNLLEMERDDYVKTICDNRNEELIPQEELNHSYLDEITHKILNKYGSEVYAETYLNIIDENEMHVFDNVAFKDNLKFMYENLENAFVAGLKCSWEDQVNRMEQRKKSLDEGENIEGLIKSKEKFLKLKTA